MGRLFVIIYFLYMNYKRSPMNDWADRAQETIVTIN